MGRDWTPGYDDGNYGIDILCDYCKTKLIVWNGGEFTFETPEIIKIEDYTYGYEVGQPYCYCSENCMIEHLKIKLTKLEKES